MFYEPDIVYDSTVIHSALNETNLAGDCHGNSLTKWRLSERNLECNITLYDFYYLIQFFALSTGKSCIKTNKRLFQVSLTDVRFGVDQPYEYDE